AELPISTDEPWSEALLAYTMSEVTGDQTKDYSKPSPVLRRAVAGDVGKSYCRALHGDSFLR
ncbi:hypothetical protein CEXT_116501, partial [Caerostris extrusa]